MQITCRIKIYFKTADWAWGLSHRVRRRQQQQLTSSLSVSHSTEHCLTNEMLIMRKITILCNITIDNIWQSIAEYQLGYLGSCCYVFSDEVLAKSLELSHRHPLKILKCLVKTFCMSVFLYFVTHLFEALRNISHRDVLHFCGTYLLHV